MEWEWSALVTSPLNSPNSTRCSASPLNNHDSRSGLRVRQSLLPGNRILRPETTRPKTPASRHGSRERLKRESRRPPIRGYLGVAGKSLVASECVVETRGLELRAWHAVTSNKSLTQLNRTGPANFPPSVQRALFLRKHRGIAPDQSLRWSIIAGRPPCGWRRCRSTRPRHLF